MRPGSFLPCLLYPILGTTLNKHRRNIINAAGIVTVSLLTVSVAYLVTLFLADAPAKSAWLSAGVIIAVLASCVPMSWRLIGRARFGGVKMEQLVRDSVYGIGLHALCFLSILYLEDIEIDVIGGNMLALFYAVLFLLLPPTVIILRTLVKRSHRNGRGTTRVIIVGSNETAARLCEAFSFDPGYGYNLMGVFADHTGADFDRSLIKGTTADINQFVTDNDIDEIYCTLDSKEESALRATIKAADKNMIGYYYVPSLSRYAPSDIQPLSLGHMVVFASQPSPLSSVINRAFKRSVDILLASTATLLFPVIFIPIAISIKASSFGPIFYKQRRTGLFGKEFTCLKFRTMRETGNGNNDSDEARVTKVGKFLRHTSLDELPQIFNILAGDMSIVGPRPHMVEQTEQYSRLIERYMMRHSVKPGLTGWAQVNGLRGTIDELWKMERRVEYDVWYIGHWSIMLDLQIIIRTALNLIRGDENAR